VTPPVDRNLLNSHLVRRARSGDPQAMEALIAANRGLIARVARRFAPQLGPAFDWDDLMQEGAIALLHALQAFDPERGCRFVTLAYVAVQRHLSREVARQCPAIRLPLEWQGGDESSPRVTDSLDEPVGEEENGTLGELIADTTCLECEIVERVWLEDGVQELALSDREIIRQRHQEQRTRADIAARLGISGHTVARREEVALAQLRALLGGEATRE
jgi:RNA polymerase sigma factor (sigma-70 family)